ncbi:hypothetical protein D3OALGB2SA_1188 [Olavius algarvensis associated proteobacterium Delta 3]|nr:hypothetical protein D3OALGB2SA_1188 [Olavius algarvensis associated proteobacterium Delta 3]
MIADNQSCTWNEFFETVRTYYPRLRVTHVPEKISYAGARILDVLYPLVGQSNPYPSGAVSCWNLSLPVKPGSFRQVCGFDLQFPSIHDGIPAVLDDSISFYWLPSNLDLM